MIGQDTRKALTIMKTASDELIAAGRLLREATTDADRRAAQELYAEARAAWARTADDTLVHPLLNSSTIL